MNELIGKILRAHVADIDAEQLSSVKFNTAGSPLRTTPNVLFFCFAGDEPQPRWCLKTVRAPRDNAVITDSFSKLEVLNRLAEDMNIFARAIWSGEVDGIAWSIEEAAPGRRPGAAEIPRVIGSYTDFQKKIGITRKVRATERVEILLRELEVREKDRAAVSGLLASLEGRDLELLPQHGDFTADNVLVDISRVTLVDCDSYMPEGIAGFDLFHFLIRTPSASERIPEYLREYRQALGIERSFDKGDLFLWLLQERALKRAQGARQDPENLVSAVERTRPLLG